MPAWALFEPLPRRETTPVTETQLRPWTAPTYLDAPRNVYWETTIACDLVCRHCRADAIAYRDPLELAGEDARAFLDDVRRMGSMLILTGGDPMKRPDLFSLIAYAREIGIPTSITPSATPTLTRDVVQRFRALGIAAMGLSLDGPTPAVHDAFRGITGTFDRTLAALAWAAEAGLPVQVNTTVTKDTLPHLPALYEVLRDRAAPPVRRWSLFVLVPVGRGTALKMPEPAELEDLFEWVYEITPAAPFHVSTVEAPHYRRYWTEQRLAEGATREEIERAGKRMGFGMRDGHGVVFVSHRGDVFPAGFLPAPPLGNVRDRPLSAIYRDSAALRALRDMDALEGKCGRCEYRWICGGSRARAYAVTGRLLGPDPACLYEPSAA